MTFLNRGNHHHHHHSISFGDDRLNGDNHHHSNHITSRKAQARVREMPDFLHSADSNPSSEEDFLNPSVSSVDDDDVGGNKKKTEDFERAISGLGMKKAVKYSRMAVLCILLLSMVGLAVFVYKYTDNSELRQFERQFDEDALKILKHVATEIDFMLAAADAFLVDEINVAELTNQSWPFVTNQRFAVRAAKLRSLTKALVVITYPLVTDQEREQWETYSANHDGWVDEVLHVQKGDENFRGTQMTQWSSWDKIHGNAGLHLGPGPYFPTWESYPIAPLYAAYNWDIRLVRTMAVFTLRFFHVPVVRERSCVLFACVLTERPSHVYHALQHYMEEVDAMMTSKKAVIGKTDNLPEDGGPENFNSDTVQWVKGYTGPDEDPTEPLFVIYYPILARDELELRLNVTNESPELLGAFVLTIFWRQLIRDIFAPGSVGIDVVFENECGQALTVSSTL